MHRDVKPHNVMIDHDRRTVECLLHILSLVFTSCAASTYRLGFGRILPPEDGVQCTGRLALLQGA